MKYQSSTKPKPSLVNHNGMISFSFHVEDQTSVVKNYRIDELATALKRTNPANNKIPSRYFQKVGEKLMMVLTDELLSGHFIERINHQDLLLEYSTIETWQLAKTYTIKFAQTYQNIPIYAALVTVEVDENKELLAINSMIGLPVCVDTAAKLRPDEVQKLIKQKTGRDLTNSQLKVTTYFYFDSQKNKWRLVYYVDNKIKSGKSGIKFELIPEMVDYIIDAHTGDLVSQLPRVKTTQPII
ncbi:MAG: hypothetical protein ACFKPT_19580 [Gloeotrichia echinulata GP01]